MDERMGRVAARVGSYEVGDGAPLLLIAGLCVLEELDLARRTAEAIARAIEGRAVQWVFKASFDKANRTSISSYRGPGIDAGLEQLDQIGSEFGVPVTTDIHEPGQAAVVAEVCELLQIPAFLCRQTDLLTAAAATGKAVHVKKGQFLAPQAMEHVVGKLREAGGREILLCERGTFFGYDRLVNDFRALPVMRRFGVPVVFDATHSVQRPGGGAGVTGGEREWVAPLARAATAVGIDGLFVETHPQPDRSPSDGANMVPTVELARLLDQVLTIRAAVRGD